jgi:hypothetical protein
MRQRRLCSCDKEEGYAADPLPRRRPIDDETGREIVEAVRGVNVLAEAKSSHRRRAEFPAIPELCS